MYSRQIAVEYAYKWWNKRNPNFYNFDNLGGDCTNFVSQCLFAGGISMNYSQYGWFYKNTNSRSPSWTGVEQFFNFAINNQSSIGVKAKQVLINQIEVGDVIQLWQNGNRFNHSLFVTKIKGISSINSIYVTCHTNDAKDKLLSDYYFTKIRFLKILNN